MPQYKKFEEDPDRRNYIRLKSVFPIEFSIVRLQGDLPGIDWEQGYTQNVSKGGICLETSHVSESTLRYLEKEHIFLEIRLLMPLHRDPIRAVTQVAWFRKDSDTNPPHYLVGLEFRSIAKYNIKRLMSHAQWFRISSKTAILAAMLLFMTLIATGLYSYRLKETNKDIINRFITQQEAETSAADNLEDIFKEQKIIAGQISQAEQTKGQTGELEQKYKELVKREERIADQVSLLEKRKSGLQQIVVEKMISWMTNRQSQTTGLVLSFEGPVDEISSWAFIYDQALAVNVFLLSDHIKEAQAALKFFNNNIAKDFTGFNNAYYYDSGDVAEYTVHAGPNIWVGLAAMQYINKTNDDYFLPLAETIADWLIKLQDRDSQGGIKGGPNFTWFSTEHNLDAYAFFGILYRKTNKKIYKTAQEKVLNWLSKFAMIPHGKDYSSPPINRGRGDSTIATDTFAWSLAAIGPEKLKQMQMDPEAIMDFAEENCSVVVEYQRPSGVTTNVRGFDFSKYSHMPRGGLVSPEWTAQMIVSYQILSSYFEKSDDDFRSKYYREKSKNYIRELSKLIISSPSPTGQGEGCLPYSTLAEVDTGHGWNTPKGDRTCSIAGTAYTVMAMKGFNPLKLNQRQE